MSRPQSNLDARYLDTKEISEHIINRVRRCNVSIPTIFFNIIFILYGLGIVATPIALHFTTYAMRINVAAILIGAAYIFVGILGCLTFCMYSKMMMAFHALFIVLIIMAQIGLGIYLLCFEINERHRNDRTEIFLDTVFNRPLMDHSTRDLTSRKIDEIQRNLKCCGRNGYTDYKSFVNGKSNLPSSCCGNLNTDEVKCNNTRKYFKEGCKKAVMEHLRNAIIILVAIIIFILFAICVLVSTTYRLYHLRLDFYD